MVAGNQLNARSFGIDQRGGLTITSREQAPQRYAELVSHPAAESRGTSAPVRIAVRCVIGVLVAVVIAVTEPEASATMKVIAADVATRLGMQTRKAATESHATTGEMASVKAPPI